MKRTLFERASYLSKRVRLISEGNNGMLFEVSSDNHIHHVHLSYRNYELITTCDCKAGGYKPLNLCAHKVAVFGKLCQEPNIKEIEPIKEDEIGLQ